MGGKVVITPVPGTGNNPPLNSTTTNLPNNTSATITNNSVTPSSTMMNGPMAGTTHSLQQPNSSGVAVSTTVAQQPPVSTVQQQQRLLQQSNGPKLMMANGTNIGQTTPTVAPPTTQQNGLGQSLPAAQPATNGFGSITDVGVQDENVNCEEDNSRKKNRKKRKNAEDKMEEINSIFAPRDGLDLSGDMDATDREIEQFKQFCFNSVPLQNRAKVNFDVKNIAFKKKS